VACRGLKGAVPEEEEEEQTFVLICKHGNGRGPPDPDPPSGPLTPGIRCPDFRAVTGVWKVSSFSSDASAW